MMSKFGTPIKVVKGGEQGLSTSKVEAALPLQGKKCDPEAQLVEVEPGVYDITFTCSCGEKTVLRCYSLDTAKPAAPPLPQTPAAKASPASPKTAV